MKIIIAESINSLNSMSSSLCFHVVLLFETAVQADFKLDILLPLPSQCWDYT
jgi:hypothetical protein